MFMILIFILGVSLSIAQTPVVEYYENLIEHAIEKIGCYKQRTDNTDLLGRGYYGDIIDYGKFDFIIVGGGTSGAVLARRLSEKKNWNILLLEAGGLNDDLSDIPYLQGLSHLSPKNWGYLSEPKENACTAHIDNRCPINRGKLLGGTSAVDYVLHVRGSRKDINDWAALGNPGWSYDDLLPYFKKIENFTINRNSKYHGFKGPINIDYARPNDVFDAQLITTNEEVGIPRNFDYTGANLTGSGRPQNRVKNGVRCSSATYIKTLNSRSNLQLTLNAFVTKIMITNKTARGVQFTMNGAKYTATANKEVIVSAGGINSPQLLKLSGLGPTEELQNLGIEVVQNLPVGLRLTNKVSFSVYYTSNFSAPAKNLTSLVTEYVEGTGLLTTDENIRVISAIHDSGNTSRNPNLLIIASSPSAEVSGYMDHTNYKQEIGESFRNQVNLTNNFIETIWLTKPQSSNGSITLNSADPADFPKINIDLLSDKRDLRAIYNGIQLSLRKSLQPRPRAVDVTPYLPFSVCDNFGFGSRNYWYCAIRALARVTSIIGSTVKMGPLTDRYAVVNNKLKVYGVKNLRVADYAVIPLNTNGAQSTLGFVIGEKAADLIKSDY